LDSEANVPLPLKNLSEFTALFFKHFFTVDMNPIMTYLLNRMKENDSFHETLILSNIM
jgi:hypothetical protein